MQTEAFVSKEIQASQPCPLAYQSVCQHSEFIEIFQQSIN